MSEAKSLTRLIPSYFHFLQVTTQHVHWRDLETRLSELKGASPLWYNVYSWYLDGLAKSHVITEQGPSVSTVVIVEELYPQLLVVS